jgi:hypothetical protein
MSDDPVNPRRGEDIDAGTPIEELAGFEHPPSSNLMSRIRRAIQRRTTVSQVASFSWNTPFIVFREFWIILAEQLLPTSARKDHKR